MKKKYNTPVLVNPKPSGSNKNLRDVLADASVYLWREIFPHGAAQKFSDPRIRGWLTHGRCSSIDNLNSRMKELFRAMRRAGFAYADVLALIEDLQVEAKSLYETGEVTAEELRYASLREAEDNALENRAQQIIDQAATPENAEAYYAIAIRAQASRQAFAILARRYSQQARRVRSA